MLERLLESKSKKERTAAGAIASVVTHTVVIAAALYATAQARVQPAAPRETMRAVYFPPAPNPGPVARPTTRAQQPFVKTPSLTFVAPRIDINTPRIDATDVVSRPGDFSPGPIASVGSYRGGTGGSPADGHFRADQVEKQVTVVPGSAPPRYPEVLRNSGVEGRVIAEFVVDEHGRVEDASVRFARSDNSLFDDAVRVALRRMRFVPAEVGGRKVKQLVQMPFVFTLER
jgi:protein TonB